MKLERIRTLVGIGLLIFAAAAFAQPYVLGQTVGTAAVPAAAKGYRNETLKSTLMARDMLYRVILPTDAKAGEKFSVIYLLHGLTGHFSNWTDKTKLVDYAARHRFIIVTPEGDNGWYSDSVATPNDKYESYIIRELIPEIEKKYPAIADRDHRVIAGLSMGGYGSIKFALKYPEMFTLAGSFSGALGATSWGEKTAGALIGKSIDAIFGPEDSDIRKANDIFRLARELTPERRKALPFIYQSCGTEDFLIKNNQDFLAILNEKTVAHEYREHPGIHSWDFWDDQVREFLDLAERRMKR